MAVDPDVAVAHELARLGLRAGETEAEHDLVEAPLELLQQQLARDALLLRGALEGQRELALEHAVEALDLLLLAQLQAVALQLFLMRPPLPCWPGA